MSLTWKRMRKELFKTIDEIQTLLFADELDDILREGIRKGYREFSNTDGVKYQYVLDLLGKLWGIMDSKPLEVRDIFRVSEGYLILLPDGTSKVKVFIHNGEAVGLVLYRQGVSYRLFKREKDAGYSVSVINSFRVLGESFVKHKTEPYERLS